MAIRNFKDYIVKEEQEIVTNWKEIQKTKGFQQVKKIVNNYGYELLDANISRYKTIKKKYILI